MPGGMGGGLMGMLMKGAMGGMNRNPAAGQTQAAETIADDYDVARWQRADGLDAAPTMVQAVRADWERKKAEEQKKSPLKRFFSRFSRKKEPKGSTPIEPEPRPAGGTIVTPEMKKTSQRITPALERDIRAEPLCRRAERRNPDERNYLGLSFQTQLDSFFTVNPVNSAILAVDSLGMGALTLNQVTATPAPDGAPQDRADQLPPDRTQAGEDQNSAPSRPDANYMNEFRKSREQQKYNVRIRESR